MNLAEWAQSQHIHPETAYRWFWQGRLPVEAQRVGGLIMVGDLDSPQPRRRGRTVVYARVSSADQRPDLDRQVARVTAWATSNGHTVDMW
jgi:putative resolvase